MPKRPYCITKGCKKHRVRQKRCRKCWLELTGKQWPTPTVTCSVEGCDKAKQYKKFEGKYYCWEHYKEVTNQDITIKDVAPYRRCITRGCNKWRDIDQFCRACYEKEHCITS